MIINSRHTLVVLLCLLFSGCASAPAVLKFDLEGTAGVVWPATPEVARYQYVGQLTGEENFINPSNDVSIGRKVFEWLTGVMVGEKPPTVL